MFFFKSRWRKTLDKYLYNVALYCCERRVDGFISVKKPDEKLLRSVEQYLVSGPLQEKSVDGFRDRVLTYLAMVEVGLPSESSYVELYKELKGACKQYCRLDGLLKNKVKPDTHFWYNVYKNDDERKFFTSLSRNTRWNWRGIDGIQKDTNLSSARIGEIKRRYSHLIVDNPREQGQFAYWERVH